MDTAVKNETFGKDLGLVSDVVAAARELGAGKDFWGYLAQDREVLGFVVRLVLDSRKEWLALSEKEVTIIREWLCVIERNPCVFPEMETYHSKRPLCDYVRKYDAFHKGSFSGLFRKASQSKEIAYICGLVEAVFAVSYLLSGYYSAKLNPKENSDGHKWADEPFGAITTHFNDLWSGNRQVPIGKHFWYEDFKKIPGLEELRAFAMAEWRYKISEIVERLTAIRDGLIKTTRNELYKLYNASFLPKDMSD